MSFFGDPSAATIVAGVFVVVVAFVIVFLLESVLSRSGGRLDMRSLADAVLCGLVGIVGVALGAAFVVHGSAAGVGVGVIFGGGVDVVALVAAGVGGIVLRRRRMPRLVAMAGIALLAGLALFVCAHPAWASVGVLVVPSVVAVAGVLVYGFFCRR